MAEGYRSLPYGIIRTVRASFRRLGLCEFPDCLKGKGPRKVVKPVKNPFFKVKSVKVEVEMTPNPWLEEDIAKANKETEKDDCGWFRLECSSGSRRFRHSTHTVTGPGWRP